MHSSDGGATWSVAGAGLAKPDGVAAIGFVGDAAGGLMYVSDSTGIFVGTPSQSWQRVSSLPGVVDLAAGQDPSRLYATSATDGVQILENGAWRPTDSLASPHQV